MNENNFNDYLNDVKSQLSCNASNEYKTQYIVYEYLNDDIDNHLSYFESCYQSNLSAYKALLFFADYLIEIKK